MEDRRRMKPWVLLCLWENFWKTQALMLHIQELQMFIISPFEKATIANNMRGDLFVSFHRNSAPNADMYNGVQTLVYNDQGLKAELARNINENLVALGFADKGVVERPNLVVLKRTKMPAVLIEAGFINSAVDKKSLIINKTKLPRLLPMQ